MIARAMLRADGGKDMPEHLTIGTQKAFEKNYAFPYEKKQIASETVYVCTKRFYVLVLRCEKDIWTAYDSAVSADGSTLQCRQPVFRCLDTDMTQAGWHEWQINYAAKANDDGLAPNWQGALRAETRVL